MLPPPSTAGAAPTPAPAALGSIAEGRIAPPRLCASALNSSVRGVTVVSAARLDAAVDDAFRGTVSAAIGASRNAAPSLGAVRVAGAGTAASIGGAAFARRALVATLTVDLAASSTSLAAGATRLLVASPNHLNIAAPRPTHPCA